MIQQIKLSNGLTIKGKANNRNHLIFKFQVWLANNTTMTRMQIVFYCIIEFKLKHGVTSASRVPIGKIRYYHMLANKKLTTKGRINLN